MTKYYLRFFLAILLFTSATHSVAQDRVMQNNFPAVYNIKTDTGTANNVDLKYWQYLEDPTQKLTISQVSSPAFDGRFHSLDPKKMGARKARTCWYRYNFQNITGHQVKLMLPATASVSDLYRYDTVRHQWNSARNGTDVPWSKRAGLKQEPYFIYTLNVGERSLIYERAVSAGNSPSTLRDYSVGYYNDIIQKYYIDESIRQYEVPMSVLTGILLLAGLINLIFFGIVKERFYLYFGLYALFAAFSNFLGSTNILFREHPGFVAVISVLATALSMGFNVAFTRIYLHTREFAEKTDRWLVVCLVVFFILQLVVLLFVEDLPLALANVVKLTVILIVALINLLITITLAKMLARKLPGAGVKALIVGPLNLFPFFLFSFLLVNIIALLTHTTKTLWDSTNWLRDNYNNMTLFAGSWLIIGMSVVLFKRFQDLQNKIAYDALDKERVLREQEEERNQLIAKQNKDLELQVTERTAKLSRSLTELKATQAQLIQSAKMASLGELTAGIAHEIQNPLNFVNNFSDVNQEMIDEAEEELRAGHLEDALALLADIKSNETKINHHGKRADSIVKGMLEHSRTSSGRKELTDINKLTDEYLRLAYHGLRAKDNTFNAALITLYDEQLPLVNVIPQEIGRVLLNLFNNAFYAVREQPNADPAITVTTTVREAAIHISIKDNGPGIPEDIKEKIMQPFFTTKPTGQGTGLGLSLSYDIIVKSHGGSLMVNSIPGSGAELIIQLPLA